jgi:hypothetical protein
MVLPTALCPGHRRCGDPQTGNACPQCGSQSWGWFATAPNNSLITARDAGETTPMNPFHTLT